MKRSLTFVILVLLLAAGFASPTLSAQTVTDYQSQTVSGAVGFRITKVEFRDDLTRVYGELIGKPHTAARIDEITLTIAPGKSYGWTDIDGIDANRYFQWEDEGRIAVEIDFPAMKRPASLPYARWDPQVNLCGPSNHHYLRTHRRRISESESLHNRETERCPRHRADSGR